MNRIQNKEVVVSGKIVFDRISKPFKNANVYVKLEDVSKQNAPSEIIAKQVFREFEVTQEAIETMQYPEIEFVLRGEIIDWKGIYTVTAHVDVDRNGKIGIGDYITQAYYPVLTRGHPNYVIIKVSLV